MDGLKDDLKSIEFRTLKFSLPDDHAIPEMVQYQKEPLTLGTVLSIRRILDDKSHGTST